VLLDLDFALTQPWTVLFGPSGSGKTTVLRAIAGFVKPDEGSIVKGKNVLMDSLTGVFVQAHERPVRSAAQTPWLFPHMTVMDNVLFGCGWTSKPADEVRVAGDLLELFRIRGVAERRPVDLSGGERQRVSVLRAVLSAITFPEGSGKALLLLDEPFSGLDAVLRDELLAGLREWLRPWKTPVLLVTHDVGEAFRLGAEVIRLLEGRVAQQGPAAKVLADERQRLLEQLAD
jgi:molybdate transport system ATP-binding protein